VLFALNIKKMVDNKYQAFQEKFGEYLNYSQATQEVYSNPGEPSRKARDLVARCVGREDDQAYISQLRDKDVLLQLLKTISDEKATSTRALTTDLESLLKDAPKEDLSMLTQIVPGKNSYSGSNAELYTEIAKSQKDYREMVKIVQEKDIGKIREKIKGQYKTKYSADTPEEKLSLKLMNIIIDMDERFAGLKYQGLLHEKQEEMQGKLKDNEAGYVAANLEGKDFIEFYAGFMQAKEQARKQSEASQEQ
jgi:hypothetical protein